MRPVLVAKEGLDAVQVQGPRVGSVNAKKISSICRPTEEEQIAAVANPPNANRFFEA